MGVEGPTMTCGILSTMTRGISYMDAPTGEEPSEVSKGRPFAARQLSATLPVGLFTVVHEFLR